MNPVRFECPKCQQPIETDEVTARNGVRCPGCGTGFVPEGFRHVAAAPAAAVPAGRRLAIQAAALGNVAFLLASVGLIALMFCLLALNDHPQQMPLLTIVLSAGFFGAAFWVYLVAQLVHIRALLTKDK
jgi:hypothetical protein